MNRNWLWVALAIVVAAESRSPAEPIEELTLPRLQTTAPLLQIKNKMIPPREFPPVGSEERYWACLVSVDPINRRGVLRHEMRDRMIEFTLLPYAALYYRGAPASLADFPIGTMVEVWAYGDRTSSTPKHVLRFSDDFSVKSFANQAYRIDGVDPGRRTFSATLLAAPRTSPPPYEMSLRTSSSPSPAAEETKIEFSFTDQTRWYRGRSLAEASDLAVGQLIKVNFMRKLLNLHPPVITRCSEVWLDAESQDLATALQLKSFTVYLRDRGYPLRIDTVDNQEKVLTATLLETGLPYQDWKIGKPQQLSPAAASLRTWEPNGGQGGSDSVSNVILIAVDEVPAGYGCAGVRLTLKVPYLIEGFRPGFLLRIWPAGIRGPQLPIEERLPKEFDPFLR